MADYRHSHIVPAGYLKAWADDGLVRVGWTDDSPRKLLPPRAIGVRSGFYRELHPDGSTSDRLDPAMGSLEGKALEVIRNTESRWPLAGEARGRVAEFIALQLLRTPAWREWYALAIDVAARQVRQANPQHDPVALQRASAQLVLDSERHTSMMGNVGVLTTLLANMRWTLLRCGSPRLATSDHPVVPVPLGRSGVLPVDPVPVLGFLHTAETRLALAPHLLLLLTWADDFSEEVVLKMTVEQVRNHNSTVIEQADKQWFEHPRGRAERVAGPWNPLCHELHGAGHMPQGHRWTHVKHTMDEMTAGEENERDIRLIDWGVPRQAA